MLWKGLVEKWSLDIVMKDNDDDDFVLAIISICIRKNKQKPFSNYIVIDNISKTMYQV